MHSFKPAARRRGRNALLQVLRLCCVPLLQRLRLLLVLLLHLLRRGVISLLFRQLLVFLVLLLLKFLPLLILLRGQLLLLFPVFLVQLRISCIWRGRALRRRKIVGMDCRVRRTGFRVRLTGTIFRSLVSTSCVLRLYHPTAAKFSRP